MAGIGELARRIARAPLARARARRLQSTVEARERFLGLARGFTPYVVVEAGGAQFLVPTDDATLRGLFSKERFKEESVLARALDCLDAAGVEVRRTTFVDIGANIGTTSLAALAAGFSSVVAVEPSSRNFRLLRANLALNDAEGSVRPLELALSNHGGSGRLDLAFGSTKTRVLADAGRLPQGHLQEVRLARLDDLVDEGILDPAAVGMVWMDVEGHEPHVLDGGARVLETSPPLVIELNGRVLPQGGVTDRLVEILAAHYTHVLDLRVKAPDPALMPIGHVEAMIEAFVERQDSTDVLVCRVPA